MPARGIHPVKVLYTAMEFTNGRDDWYRIHHRGTGLLIPNTWKMEPESFLPDLDLRPPAMPWSAR